MVWGQAGRNNSPPFLGLQHVFEIIVSRDSASMFFIFKVFYLFRNKSLPNKNFPSFLWGPNSSSYSWGQMLLIFGIMIREIRIKFCFINAWHVYGWSYLYWSYAYYFFSWVLYSIRLRGYVATLLRFRKPFPTEYVSIW